MRGAPGNDHEIVSALILVIAQAVKGSFAAVGRM